MDAIWLCLDLRLLALSSKGLVMPAPFLLPPNWAQQHRPRGTRDGTPGARLLPRSRASAWVIISFRETAAQVSVRMLARLWETSRALPPERRKPRFVPTQPGLLF
jgi:hypothetical protein